jgi:hypothetical protein
MYPGLTCMAMRKETRSIADLVSDTAYRKRRAAQARFAGTQPGQETPRDVYHAACASIGSYLRDTSGFKYAKSGPHARRRSREFTFQVSFQSSVHNVPGEHVNLCMHGNVSSSRIKKWRESQPLLHSSEYVAGGQIGNLQANHCWLDWELADAGKRDEVICDAIQTIEELAFPYFARFEDIPSLFRYLVNANLPAMTIDCVIEFLMCFADQLTARLAAANFLKRRPDLVGAYQHDFKRYAGCRLESEHPSKYTEKLAFASHAFGFGDLTAESA